MNVVKKVAHIHSIVNTEQQEIVDFMLKMATHSQLQFVLIGGVEYNKTEAEKVCAAYVR